MPILHWRIWGMSWITNEGAKFFIDCQNPHIKMEFTSFVILSSPIHVLIWCFVLGCERWGELEQGICRAFDGQTWCPCWSACCQVAKWSSASSDTYLPFYKIFCLLIYINFYVEKGVLKKQSQGSITICNCFPHSLLFPFHHEVPWRLKLELVPYHHKINRYLKYLEIDMIISDYICSPDPRIMGLYVKVIIWLQNNHHLPMHIIIVIIQTLLDQSS